MKCNKCGASISHESGMGWAKCSNCGEINNTSKMKLPEFKTTEERIAYLVKNKK